MKRGASQKPNKDNQHRSSKCPGAAEYDGGTARENSERVTDDAKEITFLLVCLRFFGLGLAQCYFSFRA